MILLYSSYPDYLFVTKEKKIVVDFFKAELVLRKRNRMLFLAKHKWLVTVNVRF